jgi:hypothetical protein
VAQDDNVNAVTQMAGMSLGIRPEEMHLTEEWYHGNITRAEAARRIEEHASKLADPEGLFLVRDSGTFIGDIALSLYVGGSVWHMRMKTTPYDATNASRKFYLHVSGVYARACALTCTGAHEKGHRVRIDRLSPTASGDEQGPWRRRSHTLCAPDHGLSAAMHLQR